MRWHIRALLGAIITTLPAGCGKQVLEAGGSTSVQPMMQKWADEYAKVARVQLNYQAIGSQAGIDQLLAKKLDFACTDDPLTEDELKKARDAGRDILHVPLVLGAVVAAYELPNLRESLRFTGPVLAEIYLGKIKKWNDPALQKLNPKANLPDQDITVVHRRDGSGTTYIWSDYLSKVSPEWRAKIGVGTTLSWPCGLAEPGNAGVAKKVKQTPGAIGYIELTFALKEGIKYGSVQNKDGDFVTATTGHVSYAAMEAVAEGNLPADLRISLANLPGKLTYPISGLCWAVVDRTQPATKQKAIVRFLRWVLSDGQEFPEKLKYSRLPGELIELSEAELDKIQIAK
jgi:phosphate transport system substrate-binding protein